MKVAIMQPYFFPYIGYFQLIHAVDVFVVYDDVNFINRSWINRNYVLSQAQKSRLTLQLQGASQNLLINQIQVGQNKEKLLKTIQHGYAKAHHFESSFPVISNSLMQAETNLATYLTNSLRNLCSYLSIEAKWYLSSEIEKNNILKGQEKILDVCKQLGATEYINMPGGRELYDDASFAEQDIQLSFLEPGIAPYEQNSNQFIPYLSIIDVLMFNSQQLCQQMVKEYKIV